VYPRAGLDDVEKRKFLILPGLELRPSVVQPVASSYTDCAIPALCSTYGAKRNAYRVLVGKPERKRPLGRPRHMWKDNI
jgi:hypothetical protein